MRLQQQHVPDQPDHQHLEQHRIAPAIARRQPVDMPRILTPALQSHQQPLEIDPRAPGRDTQHPASLGKGGARILRQARHAAAHPRQPRDPRQQVARGKGLPRPIGRPARRRPQGLPLIEMRRRPGADPVLDQLGQPRAGRRRRQIRHRRQGLGRRRRPGQRRLDIRQPQPARLCRRLQHRPVDPPRRQSRRVIGTVTEDPHPRHPRHQRRRLRAPLPGLAQERVDRHGRRQRKGGGNQGRRRLGRCKDLKLGSGKHLRRGRHAIILSTRATDRSSGPSAH